MGTDVEKVESLRGDSWRIWEETIVGTVMVPFLIA